LTSTTGFGPKALEPLLSISNLQVSFTRQRGIFNRRKSVIRAISNVSLDLFESEILSIVGESGSGKTTTARCILSLNEPDSGSIKYKRVDVTALKGRNLQNYRREVQLIYQDPYESLNPRHDVYTAVSIPIRQLVGEHNKKRLTELVSKVLGEVGLDPTVVMHRLPHQLSGGERQRVNIAKALAPNPRLLVADEPVTMLDASQRLGVLSLLMQLKQKRNLTILLITHDLASAKIMSDRTAIMYLGRIVEIGPTSKILSKPHHPYTELILSATPRLRRSPEVKREYIPSLEESERVEKGCVFAPRCKYVTSICRETEPKLEEKEESAFAACYNPIN
jgi:peptide/nickel transport system ATP-binding protein